MDSSLRRRRLCCLAAASLAFPTLASAGTALQLDTLYQERPTLENLGVNWQMLAGSDSNRNATAAVQYRAVGSSTWLNGYDLLRSDGEQAGYTAGGAAPRWVVPNRFAGSVFGLQPGTNYEIKVTFNDPDGIKNSSGVSVGTSHSQTITQATRAVPLAYDSGNRLHVYPTGYSGAKEANNYTGLSAAYAASQPGDVILVHQGTYTGTYNLNKAATADRPIVIRSAGDGEAVFRGNGWNSAFDANNYVFNVSGAAYTHLEGLTIRDAQHGVFMTNGTSATGITLRRNKFTNIQYVGVHAAASQARDFYIADNNFNGPLPGSWAPRVTRSELEYNSHAIWLTGAGNVVAHNKISQYWDGADIWGRVPPSDVSQQNSANDFYNNDISECMDDTIETDGSVTNMRVYRNKLYNTFIPLSTQTSYGGPVYIFRNVAYNTTRTTIKTNLQPAGVLVFNNTFVSAQTAAKFPEGMSNSKFFNNLFIGQDQTVDLDYRDVLRTGTKTPGTTELDYNAYRDFSNFVWGTLKPGITDPSGPADWNWQTYATLADFMAGTGQEIHGLASSTMEDIFVNYIAPSRSAQPLPANLDLRLKSNAAVIDRGKVLANFTDGYAGSAPDMGAYEYGQALPTYGVRAEGDSFRWTGQGGSVLWTKAGNWTKLDGTSSRPTPDDAVDTALLNAASTTTATVPYNITMGQIRSTGAGSFRIDASGGAKLTLRGAGGAASVIACDPTASTLTINLPTVLDSNLEIQGAGAGKTVTFAQGISQVNGSRKLTVKANAHAVLSAANTYGGGTQVDGILRVEHASALGSGAITVSTGGTLENAAGNLAIASNLSLAAGSTYAWNGTGMLDISGAFSGPASSTWILDLVGASVPSGQIVLAQAPSIDNASILRVTLDPALVGRSLAVIPYGAEEQLILVPEPAALGLLALGTGLPTARRRR